MVNDLECMNKNKLVYEKRWSIAQYDHVVYLIQVPPIYIFMLICPRCVSFMFGYVYMIWDYVVNETARSTRNRRLNEKKETVMLWVENDEFATGVCHSRYFDILRAARDAKLAVKRSELNWSSFFNSSFIIFEIRNSHIVKVMLTTWVNSYDSRLVAC